MFIFYVNKISVLKYKIKKNIKDGLALRLKLFFIFFLTETME